jgi:uncharacterized protein (TIGR00730 family)
MTENRHSKPTSDLSRVCVFCGANPGGRDEYRESAARLGVLLARRGLELVYGGGNIGLMGVVADACLEAGGRVIGVIPESLVGREVAGAPVEHDGITRLEIVDSMHTRKARMAELSDGFIALPGGFGTFEELFEILTWAQLGFHRKPIGLLDVADYYAPLLSLCDHAVAEGFLRPEHRALLLDGKDPAALLDDLTSFQSPDLKAWVRTEREL